jgi:hypothetical protein
MITTTAPAGPYVGPRPFQTGEALFGRDKETRDLLGLLRTERIVLLHSPSGAGKTSLIQAALVPGLRQKGFRIFKPLRVSENWPGAAGRGSENDSVLRVLQRLAEHGDRQELLIFDHFEEILTTTPNDPRGRHAFFDQVGAVLCATHRYAIFAIREEFVAGLDPYLPRIPRGLAARYRLDLLGAEAAKEAIVRPAASWGVTIEPDAAETLVNDLRKVRIQKADRSVELEDGPSVEPVQLQVVCLRLWEKRGPSARITREDVANVVVSVNTALAGYYADKVRTIAQDTGVPERDIRDWCEQELITVGDTRDQISSDSARARKIDGKVMHALTDAYLVRAETRRAIIWYELAHDRLIEPIRENNRTWSKAFWKRLPSQGGGAAGAVLPPTADLPPSSADAETAADLEIAILGRATGNYLVTLRHRPADDDAELRTEGPMSLDVGALAAGMTEPTAYGQTLSRALFTQRELAEAFDAALSAARLAGVPLRIRLLIDATAPELHALRWELLRSPRSDEPLTAAAQVFFSRFVVSPNFRPFRLRLREKPRALLVVAEPPGMPAPASGEAEVDRLRRSLAAANPETVTGPATAAQLLGRLRDGTYTIVLLACHGTWFPDGPGCWFEGDDGQAQAISAREFVAQLLNLSRLPRLVVLLLHPTAAEAGSPAARGEPAIELGRRLVEAGIPAVVTFHANTSSRTVDESLRVLVEELYVDGRIDRAAAAARRHSHLNQEDYGSLILLSRLVFGQVWYESGFSHRPRVGPQGLEDYLAWPALLSAIADNRCTAILGPGLLEDIVGSSAEIARRWAEAERMAMAPHVRDDLAQVAQYLTLTQGARYAREGLVKQLREQTVRRFQELPRSAALDDLLEAARTRRPTDRGAGPHDLLARLPLTVCLTTNADDQFRRALLAAGRDPLVEVCRWREDTARDTPWSEPGHQEPRPERRRPLIYHLFGKYDRPDTLVLTEDDYFEFLIAVAREPTLVPSVVRAALARNALLFLGFRLDDWGFRVLFRSFAALTNRSQPSRNYSHLVVLPRTDTTGTPDAARAVRYVQKFFQQASVQIYWGDVEDFVLELDAQRRKSHPGEAP